jgi:hypothetical protein
MAKVKSSSLGSGKSKGVALAGDTLTTGLGSPDFHLPFFHYLAIPKNTAILSYTSYTLILPVGKINRIWVEYPKGCAGLVGFQLWRGTQQIFPLPAGNWLRSDGFTLNFAFTHLVDAEPYEVELRGYNLDDTYQHTIWISLEMSGLPNELSNLMQSFLSTLTG